MSRSGSIESKKEKNKNCGYISKNNLNCSYKNYLRDKRSKSLEKSLSRSLSRKSTKIENLKINEKNKKDIRNIRVIVDDNNTSRNEGINMLSSLTSFNDDIPVKLPERLDKNLVRRQLPQKRSNYENKFGYNFCYDNNHENNELKNHNNHDYHECYNENEINNMENKENKQYNYYPSDIMSANNLDLKIYKEDLGSTLDNGRF